MSKSLPSIKDEDIIEEAPLEEVQDTPVFSAPSEGEYERDYSKMDLVDLIDQPAWKSILLDLVDSEKMNPWDIDVTVLSEKYLKKINELENNNLRVPANAILACAILVKTKSKYLKLSSIDDDEEIDIKQRQLLLEDIPDLVANRSFREGKITLDELVSSIEDIIHRTNPKKNAARIIPRMEINFDSTSIEEKMESVFNTIKQKADSQGIVLFKNLIDAEGVDGMVDTFLPVLFLMNSGKVVAYQNEFFGEIFVQIIQETASVNVSN